MLLKHEIEIRVRYSETDGQGRLHHANFFNYFELGRTEMLRSVGRPYSDFEATGLMLVVKKIECEYHAPARFDDLLTLRTITRKSKGARIQHDYELTLGELLVASGSSLIACIGPTGKAQRLPDWLQAS